MNLFSVLTIITSFESIVIKGQLTVYDYTATNKLTSTLTCNDPNGCIVNCFGNYACDDAILVASAADVLIVNCWGGNTWSCINLAIAAGPKLNATITCSGRYACGVCSSCVNPQFLLTNTKYVKLTCDGNPTGGIAATTSASAPCAGVLTASNADIVDIYMLGDYSSYEFIINVENVAIQTSIIAEGTKSLFETTINAADSNRISIDCQGEDSCFIVDLYPPYLSGEYTTSITCGLYEWSCLQFNVRVPDSTKLPNNYLELICPPIQVGSGTCDIDLWCTNVGLGSNVLWQSDVSKYTCSDFSRPCCPWSSSDDMVEPPTDAPSQSPIPSPTNSPTTASPSIDPTIDPSIDPTIDPTDNPSADPTTSIPTQSPTTAQPTDETTDPTNDPTADPTATRDPSVDPTIDPTADPTTAAPTTASPTNGIPECDDTPFECSDGSLVTKYYSEEDGECVWPVCTNDNSSKAYIIHLFVPIVALFATFIFVKIF